MWSENWKPWADDNPLSWKSKHIPKAKTKNLPYWKNVLVSAARSIPDLIPSIATPYAIGTLRERPINVASKKLWTDFSYAESTCTTIDDIESSKNNCFKKKFRIYTARN